MSVRVGVAGPYESKAGCSPVTACGNVKKESRMIVAKVIEFYIPNKFRKTVKWVSPEQRGKIIEFASRIKKSA